ncbi:MAG: hypothetical protein WBA05_10810 [Gordonia sp. (in: high G+C Gram-positive bacteria)]|uniref:hypothetical protein n=1 Tax=Gordonia sp. (in: high G+C Gram-positive bacteria) TaxID=84139 RepID=UPI003C76F4F8
MANVLRMSDVPGMVPHVLQDQEGDVPHVLTHPMQEPRFVQPTLGRIAVGVFLGNQMTGVVGGIVWFIVGVMS